MKELLNSNPWEDFQVDNSIADTKEIYEKYIEFSKIIKQLPKKELVKKRHLRYLNNKINSTLHLK